MVPLAPVLLSSEPILLLAAERREFAGVLRRSKWKRLQWPVQFAAEAELTGRRYVLACDGAGPRCARQAALAARAAGKFTMVVSTGFCGALQPELGVGQIVVASSVLAPGRQRQYPANPVNSKRPFAGGKLLSVDRVVGTVAERRQLWSEGCVAVEMEAAGVAECASEWGVPFSCVRAISDAADHEFALDLNRFRDGDGRFRTFRIALEAVRSPWAVGADLRRLQEQSATAAEALGEFLGDCQF